MIYVLILQLRHTSNRVTKALMRLILAFGVRVCGKKKVVFSGHFVISRWFQNEVFLNKISTITKFKCQTVWIEIRPDVCLKSASLSDPINTAWRRHVILDRGRRFLDMFKTLRPAHFHAFCSQDHYRSIKTNVRQSSTLFLHFYPV